jgi:hypothetical protein
MLIMCIGTEEKSLPMSLSVHRKSGRKAPKGGEEAPHRRVVVMTTPTSLLTEKELRGSGSLMTKTLLQSIELNYEMESVRSSLASSLSETGGR